MSRRVMGLPPEKNQPPEMSQAYTTPMIPNNQRQQIQHILHAPYPMQMPHHPTQSPRIQEVVVDPHQPHQPPPYANNHHQWRSPVQPNLPRRDYTFLPSPSHVYDTMDTTHQTHMDPRSVPLQQTVSTRHNRLPSVMPVSSNSTMSTKSASQVHKNLPDTSNSQQFAPTNQNMIL